jgi:Flp pilus assembly protein TadB
MGKLDAARSVCLGENEAFMGIAVISLLIVAYLGWSNFREKRERRRRERVLEQRRRAREAAGTRA